MNQRIMIASAIILGAAAAFAAPPNSKPLEQQLKELSRATVDYTVAGKWFNLAKEIPDDDQKQEALMAAAAALIYSQKGDVYQKSVRTQLQDAAAFEDEFLKECPDCQGGGESERPCPVCKGTGRCQYANCQGGRHRVYQLNGDKYETCRECKGSGQCQKCKGRGNLEGKCTRCGGRGKRMDKDMVLAAYKKHAYSATRWIGGNMVRDERQTRGAEQTSGGKTGSKGLKPFEQNKHDSSEPATTQPQAERVGRKTGEDTEGMHYAERTPPQNPDREGTDEPADETNVAFQFSHQTSRRRGAHSIMDYYFNANDVLKYFGKEMTSVRRDAFAKEMRDRGLPLALRRRLFLPIPDGIVFRVRNVFRDVEGHPNVLLAKVEIVDGERGIDYWEFKYSMATIGTADKYSGTDWPGAPWKKQTQKWRSKVSQQFFPGIDSFSEIHLCMFRTKDAEAQLREWNVGTFLISKGWYSALRVSDREGRYGIGDDYWVVPSDEDAMRIAFDDEPEPTTHIDTIGPRHENDRILSEMWNRSKGYKYNLAELERLLVRLEKSNPAPGESMGRLLDEVLPYDFKRDIPEFKQLMEVAKGKDRMGFNTALENAAKRLSSYLSLASRTIPADFSLPENLVAAFYAEENSYYGNRLRQMSIFDDLWSHASVTVLYKNYYRTYYLPFPNGVSFIVKDVKKDGIRFKVEVYPPIYGKSETADKVPWKGDPLQDEAFVCFLAQRFGVSRSSCWLYFPLTERRVEKWDSGTIIKSDGWIAEAFVEASEVTKANRQTGQTTKEENRKVLFDEVLFPSLSARLEIERAAKEWHETHGN